MDSIKHRLNPSSGKQWTLQMQCSKDESLALQKNHFNSLKALPVFKIKNWSEPKLNFCAGKEKKWKMSMSVL